MCGGRQREGGGKKDQDPGVYGASTHPILGATPLRPRPTTPSPFDSRVLTPGEDVGRGVVVEGLGLHRFGTHTDTWSRTASGAGVGAGGSARHPGPLY